VFARAHDGEVKCGKNHGVDDSERLHAIQVSQMDDDTQRKPEPTAETRNAMKLV
jgi:hypothetical protein